LESALVNFWFVNLALFLTREASARRSAIAAGVPIVPGTTEPLKSLAEARVSLGRNLTEL